MELPYLLPILLGLLYHFIICGNLTRAAMRWSRAHPQGKDSSHALQGLVLLALPSGVVILLAGLVNCGPPLYPALMHGDRDNAVIYAIGLVISLLTALPLSGLYPPNRQKVKLMAILGAFASLATLPVLVALAVIAWAHPGYYRKFISRSSVSHSSSSIMEIVLLPGLFHLLEFSDRTCSVRFRD